jgi:hypothetical protein
VLAGEVVNCSAPWEPVVPLLSLAAGPDGTRRLSSGMLIVLLGLLLRLGTPVVAVLWLPVRGLVRPSLIDTESPICSSLGAVSDTELACIARRDCKRSSADILVHSSPNVITDAFLP